MENTLTDMQLSERARKAMVNGEYNIAINNVRRMQDREIGMQMELLIIEHQRSTGSRSND